MPIVVFGIEFLTLWGKWNIRHKISHKTLENPNLPKKLKKRIYRENVDFKVSYGLFLSYFISIVKMMT